MTRLSLIVGAAYTGCTPGYNLAFDEKGADMTDPNFEAASGVQTSIGGNARVAGANNAAGGSSSQHGRASTLSTVTGGSRIESNSASVAEKDDGVQGGGIGEGSIDAALGDTTTYGGTKPNNSIAVGGSPSGAATDDVANGGVHTSGTTTGRSTGGIANGGIANGGIANGGIANGGIANGGIANGGIANGGIANGGIASDGIANGGIANGGIANGGIANGAAHTSSTTTGRAAGGASTATTRNCPSGATFCDDFERGTAQWSPIQGAWLTATDGTTSYQCTFTPGDKEARSVAGKPSWSDYTVTARMKLVRATMGKRAHLAARFVDANNWYGAAFYLSTSGEAWVEIRKKIAGSSTSLSSKSFSWSTNKWYTVAFSVRARTLRMSIDGVQQLSTTDSSLASGQIAILGDNMQVRIDDVAVTQP